MKSPGAPGRRQGSRSTRTVLTFMRTGDWPRLVLVVTVAATVVPVAVVAFAVVAVAMLALVLVVVAVLLGWRCCGDRRALAGGLVGRR